MRALLGKAESLDINPCERCRFEHSCDKPEYDSDCWLRYVDKLRENSLIITDREWDEIFDSYIQYVCEFGQLHRPTSFVSILRTIEVNEKHHLELFVPFSQYIKILMQLAQ
jgi:hypothetical protein